MVQLGAEFKLASSPVPEDLRPPAPDPGVMLLLEVRRIMAAMPDMIAEVMARQPAIAPTPVYVSEPDLSEIVMAVNGLKPGATADDIGRAIARNLAPQPQTESGVILEAFRELTEKIDFRMQGVGRAFGASGPSNIADNPDRLLGHVTVDTMPPVTVSSPALPSAFGYGQTKVAVTSTAVQLPSHALAQGVIVQALSANAGSVYLGDSGVTTANGFELQAGQATSAGVNNSNLLYVNGTAGDGVCLIGS